jgi:acyl-CoA dehydrogenase
MLLTMKSGVEAMRALALYAAFQLDLGEHGAESQRAAAHARAELLIPVVKGWCTEFGNELTHIGIQVHGGMGFIEETGAAQYARDVRITTIYEGTTAIQANDLIGRKVGRDGGTALGALLADVKRELEALPTNDATVQAVQRAALEGLGLLSEAAQSLGKSLASTPERALAVAVPFLKLCGFVLGGWLMAKSAAVAASKQSGADRDFYAAKLRTARFYAEQVLPTALAHARVVTSGATSVTETDAALI